MKREQIIEILKRFRIKSLEEDGTISISHCIYQSEFDKVADAIITLSIDVPSDKELNAWSNNEKILDYMPETLKLHIKKKIECRIEGAKWAISEIIKRNQK
jgi:hypothetical protein